jgi:hypothetical protein
MEAWDKLKELDEAGWEIWFLGGKVVAAAGDCNCPYSKEYDPKDGHGYSQIEIEMPDDLEELIDLIYSKFKEIVPGAKYESKG